MKIIILLSFVAFTTATPINEKPLKDASPANPDISKLPLKKEEGPKIDSVKIQPDQIGVQAHPLHKRDTQTPPRVENQAVAANGVKPQPAAQPPAQPASPAAKQTTQQNTNGQQQPLYNRPAANPNAQKLQPSNNNQRPQQNNQRHPINPQQNNQKQPANTQQQLNAQRNSQPAKFNQQKTQPQPAVSAQKSLDNAQSVPITSSSSRVRREAPKSVDNKTPPQVALVNIQKPIQPGQVSRTAPKNQQASTQQKPAAPVNNQQKTQAPSNFQQKAQEPSRNARETKPVDAKAFQQAPTNSQKKSEVPVVHVNQQKRAPVKSNSRPVRDVSGDGKKSVSSSISTQVKSDSNPSVVAKVSEQHKNTNNQQIVTLSSDHQSPSFIHPLPVDQILKKPAVPEHNANHAGSAVAGSTNIQTVKKDSTEAFGSSEHKSSASNSDHKVHFSSSEHKSSSLTTELKSVPSNDHKTPTKTY